MRTWDAHYLDGRTPARRPATVVASSAGLQIAIQGGVSFFWAYPEIRQTQGRYRGEQVRLERGSSASPELLLIADPAFLESLHQLAGEAGRCFHDPTRRRTRIGLTALAAVASVGLLAALYLWGIPMAAALVAPRVPPAWEARLGQSILEHIAPPARRCMAAPVDAEIQALVARLTASPGASPYTFRVIVLRNPRVNAFALPGGTIVLLSGLLERAGTPEELAAVLAHELQHILRRHATRALLEQASAGLLFAAMVGDVSGIMAYGLEGARTVGMLRYSRRNEEEADLEGLHMLVRAQIDPKGMLTFLERLRAAEGNARGVPAYLSTHPDTSARIDRLRAEAAQTRFPPIHLSGPADWQTLQHLCRASPAAGSGR